MNQLPHMIDDDNKFNVRKALVLVAVLLVLALLVIAVVLDTPTCASASTEPVLDKSLMLAVVMRGTTITLVGGTGLVTPTPQGVK